MSWLAYRCVENIWSVKNGAIPVAASLLENIFLHLMETLPRDSDFIVDTHVKDAVDLQMWEAKRMWVGHRPKRKKRHGKNLDEEETRIQWPGCRLINMNR